jgi:sRNA-binding regulator protein Hfq
MRTAFLTLTLFFSLAVSAQNQNDKIYLHNGKNIEGNVVRVAEFTIVFRYANEDAEQTIGKYAVQKIVYGKSGREEQVTDKVVVNSKDDWENVVVLEDKSQVAGLTKVDEIKGKTAFINYRTAAGSDKKAEQKLKEEAASKGCQFILMTSDKDLNLAGAGSGNSFGNTQSVKKGVAYKY